MKATDRISSSTNNIKKTKTSFDGFRISISSSRPNGNLAISIYFSKRAEYLKELIWYTCVSIWFRFPNFWNRSTDDDKEVNIRREFPANFHINNR